MCATYSHLHVRPSIRIKDFMYELFPPCGQTAVTTLGCKHHPSTIHICTLTPFFPPFLPKSIHLFSSPSIHISVLSVSPGKTCNKKRARTLRMLSGPPPQQHRMTALTANPRLQRPCRMGLSNLQPTNMTGGAHHSLSSPQFLSIILLFHKKKSSLRSNSGLCSSIHGLQGSDVDLVDSPSISSKFWVTM